MTVRTRLRANERPAQSGQSFRKARRRRWRRRCARSAAPRATAARALALAPTAQKNRALAAMAKAIRALARPQSSPPMRKTGGGEIRPARRRRSSIGLSLDAERVEAMAAGLDVIRKLKDPVGTVMASWRRPERHAHRARAGAARRRRRDLREPARMSRPMPARFASRPAMPRSCAAVRKVSAPAARSMPRWSRVWSKPVCPPRRSRWCRPATAKRSA